MPTTFANTIDGNEILAKRSQCDYAGNDIQTTYATKAEVTTGLASKQDTISDLATIRSGAADGATAVQPGDLATVATTGAYSDLTGAPTIPTATSDLTNDSGFITLSDVPAQVNADWNSSSGASEILNKPTIPDPLPSTTGHTGDVLTVDDNGDPAWETPSAGGDAGLKYTSVPVRTSIDETCVSLNTQFLNTPIYGPNIPLLSARTYFFLIKNPWVYGQSQYNDKKLISILSNSIPSTDYYPVWVTGYNSTTNAGHHLKVKNASWSSSYSSRIIDRPDGSQTTMNAKCIKVPTPPSDISKIDTDTFDMVGDWSSDSAPIINWYLAFFNGTDFNAAGGTDNLNTSCLCYMCYEPIQPKIWSNHGLAINGYNGLYVTNPLPTATSADADKVLTVDSQGTPAWSTPAAGGVTDVEVDGTSVVSGGVASITMPTELVPAVTSSDDAKVLTATYSGGGGGSYSWVTPAGLFIAQYGVSTFAEVKAAVDANKNVYCDINPNSSNKRMAFLAYVSGNTNYEFQYYRSNSSANGTDSIFVYKVDSRNTWTTTERTVKAGNINYPVTDVRVGGTSVVRGGVALIKIPTVDQTYDGTSMNAQSGTAVAGAIATKEDAFDVGTGLEMDTSGSTPTLQVEAPVDIVAGTGIAIDNPDGNTMRITNTGFPISATDAVLCGTFRGDPMYTKTYTFTGTVGTSETTISMAIDEKKGTNNVNRIWIDPSTSFILYGSAGNNVLPLSWRLGASRQGSVAVLGASTGSLSCRCVDTSSTPITLNITIRYTVSNS